MRISIIIPCYNEEKRIAGTLEKIKEFIKKRKEKFEIIVVDDGSKDKTVEAVRNFDLKTKIIENEKNLGKGASIRNGMKFSKGDISLFMDADSSTEISELGKFLPYFKEYDIVIGSRALAQSEVIVPQGIIRRNMGFLAHKLIDFVLRTNIKDTTCGFKAFNKKSGDILFAKQLNNGWGFDYEIIFLADKFGFKLKQVPVIWKNDSSSKVTVKGYLKSLSELFMIRLNNLKGRYN